MNNRIGVGIITCNREGLFKKCLEAMPESDVMVVINDGEPYSNNIYDSKPIKLIQHKKNCGVGISKNEALRYMMNYKCSHLFLCEDDVAIINPVVFEQYIKAAKSSGILHFNFAYHGPYNKDKQGNPNPKKIVGYKENINIAFHSHLAGAFSYYTSQILDEVGFIDERFKNAFDHLDHTCQIIKAGYYPPFWWFADIAESYNYIMDLDPDLSRSVIRRNRFNFIIRQKYYGYLFKKKNGYAVADMPKTSEGSLEKILNEMQLRNSGRIRSESFY